MILKVVLLVLLVLLLGITGYFLYATIQDLNANPVSFVENKTIEINQPSYNGSLQFYPNMRFASNQIRYNIDSSCSQEKMQRMIEAFDFLESKTPIRFFEGDNVEISCQEIKNDRNKDYYIAGEGGPLSIVNTSLFYVIEKGRVLLFYKESSCDNYNIELHELLHVLGFEHSSNKNSIMYNTTTCNQVVTSDILEELTRLYSIEELPDLYFVSISAIKQGRYLNFSAEVRNRGLKNADNVVLELYSDNKEFYNYSLENIGYGEGKVIWGLTRLPSGTDKLKVVIADGDELDLSNNIVSLYLPS